MKTILSLNLLIRQTFCDTQRYKTAINPFHVTSLFLCPRKYRKTGGFQIFPGGIESD